MFPAFAALTRPAIVRQSKQYESFALSDIGFRRMNRFLLLGFLTLLPFVSSEAKDEEARRKRCQRAGKGQKPRDPGEEGEGGRKASCPQKL